eukprot:4264439-Heterocapsa_arctica.AAC.1
MDTRPHTEEAEQTGQGGKEKCKEITQGEHKNHALTCVQVIEMLSGASDRTLWTDGWLGLAGTAQDFALTDQAKQ